VVINMYCAYPTNINLNTTPPPRICIIMWNLVYKLQFDNCHQPQFFQVQVCPFNLKCNFQANLIKSRTNIRNQFVIIARKQLYFKKMPYQHKSSCPSWKLPIYFMVARTCPLTTCPSFDAWYKHLSICLSFTFNILKSLYFPACNVIEVCDE
jgi:hypothetical protein